MNEARSEVRAYLRRLIISIVVGIVLMASAAVWAYRTYGAKLNDRPPLPAGKPPINGAAPAR